MNERIYCDCKEYGNEAYIYVKPNKLWPEHVIIHAESHGLAAVDLRLTKRNARELLKQLREATTKERAKREPKDDSSLQRKNSIIEMMEGGDA